MTATTGAELCLVVPCAGFGRRLGLPYPKELAALGPGCALLDAALAPFLTAGRRVRIVAVIREHKLDTVAYLARYLDDVAGLAAVFQPGDDDSLAAAVAAAASYTADRNALVLPDQLLGPGAGVGAVVQAASWLDRHPVTVVAHRMSQAALAGEGAIALEHSAEGPRAVLWCDKPADPGRFDAAWAAVLFAGSHTDTVVADLAALEAGHELAADPPGQPEDGSGLAGAPVTLVDDYINVSTWDALATVTANPGRWRP